MGSELAWKELRWPVSYANAKRRTPRDAVGTAYWLADPPKHRLYVKIGEDRWLCFGARSIDACLDEFRRKPGAGGPASDHLIANGIATGPRDKAPNVRVTLLPPRSPERRPRRLTAKLTPNEIWDELEARGAQVLRRAVSRKELDGAEKTLRFRFPPSYVSLVIPRGAPAIGRSAKGPVENLSFAVLTPREVVRFTKAMRTLDVEMFEDPASLPRVRAQLAKAVLFQFGRDAGDGHVFLMDTVDDTGEMKVADFSHDYIEELDWRASSKVVFRSLSASTLRFAKEIALDLP